MGRKNTIYDWLKTPKRQRLGLTWLLPRLEVMIDGNRGGETS